MGVALATIKRWSDPPPIEPEGSPTKEPQVLQEFRQERASALISVGDGFVMSGLSVVLVLMMMVEQMVTTTECRRQLHQQNQAEPSPPGLVLRYVPIPSLCARSSQ